jgi:uncharacterized membrane protein
LQPLARVLIALGVCIILAGLLLLAFAHIPLFGKLPGDLHFQFKNVHVFLPLASCLILSLILTVVINLFLRR